MNLPIIISIFGLVISAISVTCAIYFSHKDSRTTDVKEIERQVAERTEINCKLDTINQNTQEIRYDVTSVKKDVQKHGEKIAKIESSVEQEHHRINALEERINDVK